MRSRSTSEFITGLGVDPPPVESFRALGDLTALRIDPRGCFYASNYERGVLLYSLVTRRKPRTLLEIGTGRGYGTLCAAWAMHDSMIEGGRVFTIDAVPGDRRVACPLDRGDGPGIEEITRDELWAEAARPEWLARITALTGWSHDAMARWRGPPVDLAFIDGGHSYAAVEHDFYSVIEVAGPEFGILFDDYNPRFGVRKFVDNVVARAFDAEILVRADGQSAEVSGPDSGHAMVWIDSGNTIGELECLMPRGRRRRALRRYRSAGRWRALAVRAHALSGPLWSVLPTSLKRSLRRVLRW